MLKNSLIMEHFGIDEDKLEEERRQLIESLGRRA
jgi:hypothetical protein